MKKRVNAGHFWKCSGFFVSKGALGYPQVLVTSCVEPFPSDGEGGYSAEVVNTSTFSIYWTMVIFTGRKGIGQPIPK